MGRGQKSKEALSSAARVELIETFIPQKVGYDSLDQKSPTATFKRYRYSDYDGSLIETEDGFIKKFPMILGDNGEPWDLGNLYLHWKLADLALSDPPNIATLRNIAANLCMFLRWIENEQKAGKSIHELYFPEIAAERVTYRYRRYLTKAIRLQTISPGVAKARMSIVVGFYKGLIKGGLVEDAAIQNKPYESKIMGIPVVSSSGLERIKFVETTDLSIIAPRNLHDPDLIAEEGGKLRPLGDDEQEVIIKALRTNKNRELELMIFTSLFTGARIQTVCTLRIKHIHDLLKTNEKAIKCNSNTELKLKVGVGTSIDVKGQSRYGKAYRLFMPAKLAQMLLDYASSERARSRRKKSFYGDTEENYLFLSRNGTPFYTSRKELIDRQNKDTSKRVSYKNRVDFPVSEGQSVREMLKRLHKHILREHDPTFKQFRFHDLRATYGLNYVKDMLDAGVKPSQILQDLMTRMGHANIQTTMGYLKYAERNDEIKTVTTAHYKRLTRYSSQ